MLGRIGQWFDTRKRRSALRKSVAKLKKADSLSQVSESVFDDLVYGWGEENNPPTAFFLRTLVAEADRSDGTMLMCGAGLATLLLGIYAEKQGSRVWVLESNTSWFRRVKGMLAEHNIDGAQMVYAPLCDYKGFSWYGVDRNDYPRDFSLVICDGPPGDAPGGRVGLYNVMYEYLADHTVTLMNDVADDDSQKTLTIWRENLKAEIRMTNKDRSFVWVVFDKDRVTEAAKDETGAPDSDRTIYL